MTRKQYRRKMMQLLRNIKKYNEENELCKFKNTDRVSTPKWGTLITIGTQKGEILTNKPDTFRHCNAAVDGYKPVKTQSTETKINSGRSRGKVEVMKKIDNDIEKKMMKSGAMGTETVTVEIQPTEAAGMKNYIVIEDNGGGLTLVVFAEGEETIEYMHSGYEYDPGRLTEDLEKLKNGDNPANEWEGNELDSIDDMFNREDLEDLETWFPWEQKGTGWKIVADNDGVYPEDMGTAAKLEFGYEC